MYYFSLAEASLIGIMERPVALAGIWSLSDSDDLRPLGLLNNKSMPLTLGLNTTMVPH